ncbi:MAG TPA: prepilin peptidase, partial [Methylophilaceae bacterium]|nr:prepilin peptidase [Methylophilaceae bacterium]
MFDSLVVISHFLREHAAFFITLSAIFGLMIGSFLNVVIHRLPKMMEREWRRNCQELKGEEAATEAKYNLVVPRSACPGCGHKITALENIPVLSYVFLRGKCSGCKTHISARYPLVEVLTGALVGLIAWQFGYSSLTVAAWIFTFALIALTFIDFDTFLLPDGITFPLLWLGLLYNLNGGFTTIQSAVLGAVAGYLILWSIYWLFKLVT